MAASATDAASDDVEYACATCGAPAGLADLDLAPRCRACVAPAPPPAAAKKAAARAAAEKDRAQRAAAASTAAALAAIAGPGAPAGAAPATRAAQVDEVDPVAPEPSDYAPAVAPAGPRAGAPSRDEWLAAADAREGWLEKLDPADPEAAAVVERFINSAGRKLRRGARKRTARAADDPPPVVAVYRARNPAAELMHEQCRARLQREAGAAEAPALTLYHGTDRAAAGAIVRGGFDASRSGAHGEMLGRGIYLSTTASYSMGYAKPDAVGGRAMLVCSALVGVVGRHSACHDNIYCVRREMQALPLYVIWS